MGVIFFIYNAIFALTLLILVLIASIYAIVSKNPDTRYQPMRDDRGSFIKSQTQLTTELDALGATARGDVKPKSAFDDDDTSFSSGNGASVSRQHLDDPNAISPAARQAASSPVDPSVPLFPSSNGAQQRGPPPTYNAYSNDYYGRAQTSSPAPRAYGDPVLRTGSANPHTYRSQNNASPWQRGAGYDH